MAKKISSVYIVWRLFLFVPLIVSQIFLKIRPGFDYTTPLHYQANQIYHFLLYPWANFDGVYYLTIAGSGYTVDNAGFFPLFPIFVKIFSFNSTTFSYQQFFSSLILVLIFTFISLIFFEKLVKIDYRKEISFQSVLFLLLFPTSFFLATIYSESLFFLLLILSFYFARKGNWLLSSISAGLLTATRLVGIAIIPALLFEFYIQNKTLINKKILFLFLTPLGLIAYSLFNFYQWGRPLQFIAAQGTLHNSRTVNGIILFPQTLFRYFKILTSIQISFEWWIAFLELSTFIFILVMLYVVWKKKIRTSYLIFSVLAFLIPASSGTFSGLPRYSLILFPIFIALALVKNKWLKIAYSLAGIILVFILLMLFSKGYYIS